MADMAAKLGELDFAGDDHVVPFQVEGMDVRGRAVQLGPILDAIMGRHQYPPAVARLLAEAIVLTVLIGTSLKFEGRFTVQTKGDGPVDLLVVDFNTPSAVRAYARFDEEGVKQSIAAGHGQPQDLLGRGMLAFTIDQGRYTQPYQGIVALDGASLEEIAGVYFRQSEQIPTRVRLSAAEFYDRGPDGKSRHHWRAGGIIAQFLPAAPERMRQADLPGGDGEPEGHVVAEDDSWTEARTMLDTVEAAELTDPQVGAERLLFRLFHERGVRVYEPQAVEDHCSCSREKLKSVLAGFTREEVEESMDEGAIAVTCEFCSTTYRFEASEILPA